MFNIWLMNFQKISFDFKKNFLKIKSLLELTSFLFIAYGATNIKLA